LRFAQQGPGGTTIDLPGSSHQMRRGTLFLRAQDDPLHRLSINIIVHIHHIIAKTTSLIFILQALQDIGFLP
jgi:hypothetical protein